MEVPAAAEVAAAEATEVAAAKAAEVAADKAARVAADKAARVAEVSAGKPGPGAVEAEAVVKVMVEVAAFEEDRTPKPVVIAVIRIRVAVAIVVAGAIVRPVVVAAVRIAGGGASDYPGGDGRPRIVAIVGVPVSVSPNVAAMTGVAARDIGVVRVAARDIRMVHDRVLRHARMSSLPIMMADGRRISRKRQDKSCRAKRDSRNPKSADCHSELLC